MEKDKEDEELAAIKIQSAYRRHNTRKKFRENKGAVSLQNSGELHDSLEIMTEILENKEMSEELAATKIQSAYRGHSTRIKIKHKQESNVLQSSGELHDSLEIIPDILDSRGISEQLAATKIQSAFRGHNTRQKLKERKGFNILQNSGELHDSLEFVPEISDNREMSEELAATKIQSVYRGHNTRQKLKERKGFNILQNSSELHDSLEFVPEISDYREMSEELAATKIQSAYRGHNTRKKLKDKNIANVLPNSGELHDSLDIVPEICDSRGMSEQLAATKIQSAYRGHNTRQKLKKRKGFNILQNSGELHDSLEFVPEISDYREMSEELAATKIQSAYRGHSTRKKLKDKNSAIVLQNSGELHDSLEIVPDILYSGGMSEQLAATKIQSVYRGYNTRQKLKGRKGSVVLQYSGEFHDSLEIDPEILECRGMSEDLAATKIQSAYRGHQTRKKLKEKNATAILQNSSELHEILEIFPEDDLDSDYNPQKNEELAAIKIQSTYRGHATRKSLKKTDDKNQSENSIGQNTNFRITPEKNEGFKIKPAQRQSSNRDNRRVRLYRMSIAREKRALRALMSLPEDDNSMTVKSLSVPPGLEALMEGLTKEVLKMQPKDIYLFAAEHFHKLMLIRDASGDEYKPKKPIEGKRYIIKKTQSEVRISPQKQNSRPNIFTGVNKLSFGVAEMTNNLDTLDKKSQKIKERPRSIKEKTNSSTESLKLSGEKVQINEDPKKVETKQLKRRGSKQRSASNEAKQKSLEDKTQTFEDNSSKVEEQSKLVKQKTKSTDSKTKSMSIESSKTNEEQSAETIELPKLIKQKSKSVEKQTESTEEANKGIKSAKSEEAKMAKTKSMKSTDKETKSKSSSVEEKSKLNRVKSESSEKLISQSQTQQKFSRQNSKSSEKESSSTDNSQPNNSNQVLKKIPISGTSFEVAKTLFETFAESEADAKTTEESFTHPEADAESVIQSEEQKSGTQPEAEEPADQSEANEELATQPETDPNTYIDENNNAATRIQSLWRGYRARRILKLYALKMMEDRAKAEKDKTLDDVDEIDEKIVQTSFQENKIGKMINDNQEPPEHEVGSPEIADEELEHAAKQIQAAWRGHNSRKQNQNESKLVPKKMTSVQSFSKPQLVKSKRVTSSDEISEEDLNKIEEDSKDTATTDQLNVLPEKNSETSPEYIYIPLKSPKYSTDQLDEVQLDTKEGENDQEEAILLEAEKFSEETLSKIAVQSDSLIIIDTDELQNESNFKKLKTIGSKRVDSESDESNASHDINFIYSENDSDSFKDRESKLETDSLNSNLLEDTTSMKNEAFIIIEEEEEENNRPDSENNFEVDSLDQIEETNQQNPDQNHLMISNFFDSSDEVPRSSSQKSFAEDKFVSAMNMETFDHPTERRMSILDGERSPRTRSGRRKSQLLEEHNLEAISEEQVIVPYSVLAAAVKIQKIWRCFKIRKDKESDQIKRLQKPAECDELPEQRGILPAPIEEAATKIQSAIRAPQKQYKSIDLQNYDNSQDDLDNEKPVRKISIVPKHFAEEKSPGLKSNYSAYSNEPNSDDEELEEIDKDILELNQRLANYKKSNINSQNSSEERESSAKKKNEVGDEGFDVELNKRLAAYKKSVSYNSASRDSKESVQNSAKDIEDSKTPDDNYDLELNKRLANYKSSIEEIIVSQTSKDNSDLITSKTPEDNYQVDLNRRLSTYKSIPEEINLDSINKSKALMDVEETDEKEDNEEVSAINRRLSTYKVSAPVEILKKPIGEIDETDEEKDEIKSQLDEKLTKIIKQNSSEIIKTAQEPLLAKKSSGDNEDETAIEELSSAAYKISAGIATADMSVVEAISSRKNSRIEAEEKEVEYIYIPLKGPLPKELDRSVPEIVEPEGNPDYIHIPLRSPGMKSVSESPGSPKSYELVINTGSNFIRSSSNEAIYVPFKGSSGNLSENMYLESERNSISSASTEIVSDTPLQVVAVIENDSSRRKNKAASLEDVDTVDGSVNRSVEPPGSATSNIFQDASTPDQSKNLSGPLKLDPGINKNLAKSPNLLDSSPEKHKDIETSTISSGISPDLDRSPNFLDSGQEKNEDQLESSVTPVKLNQDMATPNLDSNQTHSEPTILLSTPKTETDQKPEEEFTRQENTENQINYIATSNNLEGVAEEKLDKGDKTTTDMEPDSKSGIYLEKETSAQDNPEESLQIDSTMPSEILKKAVENSGNLLGTESGNVENSVTKNDETSEDSSILGATKTDSEQANKNSVVFVEESKPISETVDSNDKSKDEISQEKKDSTEEQAEDKSDPLIPAEISACSIKNNDALQTSANVAGDITICPVEPSVPAHLPSTALISTKEIFEESNLPSKFEVKEVAGVTFVSKHHIKAPIEEESMDEDDDIKNHETGEENIDLKASSILLSDIESLSNSPEVPRSEFDNELSRTMKSLQEDASKDKSLDDTISSLTDDKNVLDRYTLKSINRQMSVDPSSHKKLFDEIDTIIQTYGRKDTLTDSEDNQNSEKSMNEISLNKIQNSDEVNENISGSKKEEVPSGVLDQEKLLRTENENFKTGEDESESKKGTENLEHSGEMHDSIEILKNKNLPLEEQEELAAIKIQSAYRGHNTRKKLIPKNTVPNLENSSEFHDSLEIIPENLTSSDMSEELAATKIQSAYRGHNTRKKIRKTKKKSTILENSSELHDSLEILPEDIETKADRMAEEMAATKIQSAFRGFNTRKQLKNKNGSLENSSELHGSLEILPKDEVDNLKHIKNQEQVAAMIHSEDKKDSTLENSSELHESLEILPKDEVENSKDIQNPEEIAAIKIQSAFRGHTTRKSLKKSENQTQLENSSEIHDTLEIFEPEKNTLITENGKEEPAIEQKPTEVESSNGMEMQNKLEINQTEMEENISNQEAQSENQIEVASLEKEKPPTEQKPTEIESSNGIEIQSKLEQNENKKNQTDAVATTAENSVSDTVEQETSATKKEIAYNSKTLEGTDGNVEEDSIPDDEEKAAIKIQSIYRGYNARKQLKNEKDNDKNNRLLNSSEMHDSVELSPVPSLEKQEEMAAIKIQSTFRGHNVRKQMKGNNMENETTESDSSPKQVNPETKMDASENNANNGSKEEIDSCQEMNSQEVIDLQKSSGTDSSPKEVAPETKMDALENNADSKEEINSFQEMNSQEIIDLQKSSIDPNQKLDVLQPEMSEEEIAATKIQSRYRGYTTRKNLQKQDKLTGTISGSEMVPVDGNSKSADITSNNMDEEEKPEEVAKVGKQQEMEAKANISIGEKEATESKTSENTKEKPSVDLEPNENAECVTDIEIESQDKKSTTGGSSNQNLETNGNNNKSSMDEEVAARTIQKTFRRYKTRQNLFDTEETFSATSEEIQELLQDVNIRELEEKIGDQSLEDFELPDLSDPKINDAAVKIQSTYRGFKTRREIKSSNFDDGLETIPENDSPTEKVEKSMKDGEMFDKDSLDINFASTGNDAETEKEGWSSDDYKNQIMDTDTKSNQSYLQTPIDDFDVDSLEENVQNIKPMNTKNTETSDTIYFTNKNLTETVYTTVSSSGYDTTDDNTSSDESAIKVYRKVGKTVLQQSELAQDSNDTENEDKSQHRKGKVNALIQTNLDSGDDKNDSFTYLEEPSAGSIGSRRKRSAKEGRHEHLEHSGEMHDTIDIFLSSEELSQGQVYVIIVPRV